MYNNVDREIKGYVEVIYDIKELQEGDYFTAYYYNQSGRTNALLPFEYGKTLNDVLTTPREINNYSILYDNYVQLDNSFVLFNKNQNECGFISQETPQQIYDTYYSENVDYEPGYIIFEARITEGMKGITFYFKNNIVKKAKVKLLSPSIGEKEINIEDNDNEILFIDIDDDFTVFNMIVYEWTQPNNYVQIVHVDLGLSHVYKGDELIEFTVTEQVNKLGEEAPNNELNLTIGDYDNLYDPLNPQGITKYLTEDVTYIPYIGIVTASGIKYEKMGEFFFYKNDYKEKQVTITAYNLMYKLSKTLLENKDGSLYYSQPIIAENQTKNYLTTYLTNNYNYKNEITIENATRYMLRQLKRTNLAEFLQNITMVEGIFYIDRDNKIVVKNIDKTIVKQITKNELLQDISYKEEEKIDSFNYNYNSGQISLSNDTNNDNNFTTTIILDKEEEIICLTSDAPTSFSYIDDSSITQTGATSVTLIKSGTYSTNDFYYMIFLKVTGQVGANVTINGKTNKKVNYSFDNKTTLIKVNNSEKEPSFDLNNPIYYGSIPIYNNKFPNFIDKFYKYSVSFNYNGDPSIKAGDYIEVESNYGMIKVFVEKHVLRYAGGLSGSIEGVE